MLRKKSIIADISLNWYFSSLLSKV